MFRSILAAAAAVVVLAGSARAEKWVVGGDNIGWATGASYHTMLVKPGDTLKFQW